MTRIALVLVDDWELRGDGSGDMRRIQFDTMRALAKIYEDEGLRGSFNAECMQQLYHLKFGAEHPELARLAEEWEQVVLDVYARGHDVQLHVHSQWDGARYEQGRWRLTGDWSILNYSREAMTRMISECRDYLEALIRRIDPAYRCLSYRSGSWAIAPNDDVLSVLAELGVVFDMSIASGIYYDNAVIRLDYRDCEEKLLPYYPRMTDARRVAAAPQPIISVPTFSFVPSRWSVLKQDFDALQKRAGRLFKRKAPAPGGSAPKQPEAVVDYAVWERSLKSQLLRRLTKAPKIADLSALSFDMMVEMIASIRNCAAASGLGRVPIILENHTKDITDFTDMRRFARYVAAQDDLEVITLRQLGERLEAGEYPIRQKAAA